MAESHKRESRAFIEVSFRLCEWGPSIFLARWNFSVERSFFIYWRGLEWIVGQFVFQLSCL